MENMENNKPTEQPNRSMTLARILTRMKSITAQLKKIETDIQQYGAWSNKNRLPIGEQRVSLEKNQNQAIEYVKSAFQQYNDLVKELVTLKRVINKANNETFIDIEYNGEKLSINDALFYQKEITERFRSLTNSYDYSVSRAENMVSQYNNQVNRLEQSDIDKVLADVLYLVPRSEIESKKEFLTKFLTEVNSLINEANNSTVVEF